jgi:L-lactate dehydrogenase complex protein LldF
MNTCPVYRRSGGHSYGATVPGPIGSILNPARDPGKYSTLPYACSLCASCTDVCPVKINLHEQLLTWRRDIAAGGYLNWSKRTAMKLGSFVLNRPKLYAMAGRVGRTTLRWLPRFLVYGPWNAWGKQRDLPPPPKRSFRDEFRRRKSR